MKKLIIPVLFALVVCLIPMAASAKTICWTDGFSFFVLSGGKPGIKPFAGKFINVGSGCHGTLTGSIMQVAPGINAVSMEGNLPAPCVNFAVYGTTSDPLFNFTGTFDNNEDANGTPNGTGTWTVIGCGTVPSTPLTTGKLPNKPVAGYNPPSE